MLARIDTRPPVSPVDVRSAEPPQARHHADDQEHDFEHGHHVELPPPRNSAPYAQLDDLRRVEARLAGSVPRNARSCPWSGGALATTPTRVARVHAWFKGRSGGSC